MAPSLLSKFHFRYFEKQNKQITHKQNQTKQKAPALGWEFKTISTNIFHQCSLFTYLILPQRTITLRTIPSPLRSSHRDSFRKYLFFFSRSNLFIIFQEGLFVPRTDMNFPGGSICSSNRHTFSRRVYMFFEQTRIFQEGYSKRHLFSRRQGPRYDFESGGAQ